MSQVSEWPNTSQHSQTLFSSPYACPDRVENEEALQAVNEKVKIKVKFTLLQATKAQR